MKKLIPLETKCTWFDEKEEKNLTGWVVMESVNYYVMSTRYKKPSWNRNDDKAYWKMVESSKLTVV